MSREPEGKPGNPKTQDDDALITAWEAAKMLRLSVRTLEKMRQRGEGPEYFKILGRIWYTRATVLAYLASTRRNSTFDPPPRPRPPTRRKALKQVDEPRKSDQAASPRGV
ncbi:MAG: helix-turn-helix domain-containing protein [Pseudomonadota bacterium]|nr:helix-turn-helix domain-containing protein [Pseudomonadota bacterium]